MLRSLLTRRGWCAITGIALAVCTVAVWVLPHPSAASPRTGAAWKAGSSARLVVDRDCSPVQGAPNAASDPAASSSVEVESASSGRDQQVIWLVLFSSMALGSAAGLALTGRRGR